MLEFRRITLEDKTLFKPYLEAPGELMSSRCFPVIFLWSDYFGAKYCIHDGFLYASAGMRNGRLGYAMPLGQGSIVPALDVIERDAREKGAPYCIYLAGRCRMEEAVRAFPNKFQVQANRDSYDYIYHPQDLMELKGKKYQSKRNFVNRFSAAYEGRWEYRDVNPDTDAEAIMEFARFWLTNHTQRAKGQSSEQYELSLVQRALDYYRELELIGGLLTLDGKVIAFTFGAPGPDKMLDVMFEKADAAIPGAYQMIHQQFALNHFHKFDYINREEDMGIEGLRTAKNSYHPLMLTEKYTLTPV